MIKLRIESPDSRDLLVSLYRWLHTDERLSRAATVTLVGERREDEMGGVWDTIQIVFQDAVDLMALTLAYLSWRSSRPKAQQTTIVLVAQKGDKEIAIDADEPDQIGASLRGLEEDDGVLTDP